ncbi:MAG: YjiH family protein [Maledivibacter sp.]|jgi:nucleoside recognition membrane protein YjiH|nr:YjiH family protein [Maledivibacter sp.]
MDQSGQKSMLVTYKFIFFSLFGIFMFFIPINLMGKSTIPIDHLVTFITGSLGSIVKYYALIVIIAGGLYPFIKKTWNKSTTDIVFSILKLVGIVVAFMAVFQIGPKFLFEPGMLPFLLNKLVVSVGVIVPIGSIFLSFLVGYGLMEFVGIIMQPVMKPIWKTPGRSAIDAVASFVGSYSIGLLITNRVYNEGKYTVKEACIIATGFSTVSATFMIVVARTLDLMPIWNTYFWCTLIITFLVTAITVRIYPLSKKSDEYITNDPKPYVRPEGSLLKAAFNEGIKMASQSKPLVQNIVSNFKDGIKMAMGILPTILSVGLIGLLLAEYTVLFDILGYIFYPFTLLLRIPEPFLAAKASALEIAEMFLPALLVVDTPIVTKFVTGVISVSSILFFSASIPCIVSTDIPISIKDIIIIWIERTILSLVLAALIGHMIF